MTATVTGSVAGTARFPRAYASTTPGKLRLAEYR
jgi:hypothetical protein